MKVIWFFFILFSICHSEDVPLLTRIKRNPWSGNARAAIYSRPAKTYPKWNSANKIAGNSWKQKLIPSSRTIQRASQALEVIETVAEIADAASSIYNFASMPLGNSNENSALNIN